MPGDNPDRGLPLNSALEAQLNREFPINGQIAQAISDACRDAIAAGWMCNREAGATFDGRPASWLAYGPDSSHAPTVAGGTVRVLYLLPQGAIEFTKN